MNLLLVEDDAMLGQMLQRGLETEGHAVELATDGERALDRARAGDHDLVLLDLNLPGISGFDVSRTLREEDVQVPIIVLTARDEVGDRIAALRLGADDYLVKPFDFGELLARIDAVLRRSTVVAQRPPEPRATELAWGALRMDYNTKSVTFGTVPVRLTVKELEVLRLMMEAPDRIFSRHEILRAVWGLDEDPLTNIVEVYISRLRRKLTDAGLPSIDNVRGFGYRLAPAD